MEFRDVVYRQCLRQPRTDPTTLSPSSATAGGSAFTLTVTGTNFINGSTVRWNGANRTTTFVSSTSLTAAITAADIATAGTAPVTVFNPTPGGGTSGALTFTINAANPVPTLTSLSPSSATAGGSAFTLTLTGTNFIEWFHRPLERCEPHHHLRLIDNLDRCHHCCRHRDCRHCVGHGLQPDPGRRHLKCAHVHHQCGQSRADPDLLESLLSHCRWVCLHPHRHGHQLHQRFHRPLEWC